MGLQQSIALTVIGVLVAVVTPVIAMLVLLRVPSVSLVGYNNSNYSEVSLRGLFIFCCSLMCNPFSWLFRDVIAASMHAYFRMLLL